MKPSSACGCSSSSFRTRARSPRTQPNGAPSGFIFVLALLSFADAKPRNASVIDYQEKDELRLSDFIEHLRFVRGELHFDVDYIRGRWLKTRIVVRSNGTVTLETIGRGKSALRWLDRIQGKKPMELVGGPG